jgi:hypothetical protein
VWLKKERTRLGQQAPSPRKCDVRKRRRRRRRRGPGKTWRRRIP